MKTASGMLAAIVALATIVLVVLAVVRPASTGFPTADASLPARVTPGAATAGAGGQAEDTELVLDAEGLGDVAFGTALEPALASLADVLGDVDVDPADLWCMTDPDGPPVAKTYRWDDLSVVFADDTFLAWSLGSWQGGPAVLGLRTDEGVGVGSTVADLEDAYGDPVTLYEQDATGGEPVPSFHVDGDGAVPADDVMAGILTGHEPDDTVLLLGVGNPCG